MTERTGGSDVSNTETIAIKQPDGSYLLYGYKVLIEALVSACVCVCVRAL
jgi:alkylation response protein AidB-like acyl-CoA dehydrogenase